MRNLIARIAVLLASVFVGTIAVVVAGAFLCLALYSFLASMMAPPLAGLAAAGGVLVLAMIIIIVANGAIGKSRASSWGGLENPWDAGVTLGSAAAGIFQAFASKKPRAAILTGLAVGFIAGLFPQLLNGNGKKAKKRE